MRITAFAGQKFVKVHVWLENHGAMGYYFTKDDGGTSPNIEWFAFKGMAVELGLGLGDAVSARCEGAEGASPFKVLQVCKQTHGQEKVQYKRPPFYTWTDFEYTITSGGKECRKGDRTDGVVTLKGGSGSLTTAIRDFWQNYEKAIELDGKTLKLWLWPTEGQWPRSRPNLHSGEYFDRTIQGIARTRSTSCPARSTRATSSSSTSPGATRRRRRRSCRRRSWPWRPPSTTPRPRRRRTLRPADARTADKDCNVKLASWLRMTRSVADPQSPTGLYKAQQTCVESTIGYSADSSYGFGWMDYGDLSVPGHGPSACTTTGPGSRCSEPCAPAT